MGASSDREPVETRLEKEPLQPWVWANIGRLAVYLLVASLGAGIYGAFTDSPSGIGIIRFLGLTAVNTGFFFVVGGLGCLPGLAVWLVVLAHLPLTWPSLMRRIVSVATAPLVGAIWLVTFIASEWYPLALIFGLLLPLGAGFVVRLRLPRSV